jgi:hypothetical protein
MKKLILILTALLQSIFVQSQITLEHVYDSTNFSNYNGLYKIQLEAAGSKYVAVNNNSQQMVIYNLDHTVYKNINIAMNNFLVLYVSDHLFALDNKIEYIQLGDNGINSWIRIYNEDGIKLWEEQDSVGCTLLYHGADFMYPIFNTDSGTKLVVHIATSTPQAYKAKVYSLPGTLTTGNMELYENQFQEAMKVYPNPSSFQSTIEFKLPQGKLRGEIIIYDIVGNAVKRIPVTAEQNKLTIDNTSLTSGTYFYYLLADNYSSSTKVIVIR